MAGALFQATVAGVLSYIVLLILGVPFAGPLALIIFFLDLIPLVGATIGAVIVGVVTVFANFPTATIIWVIFSIVYQQVENNLIQPQIQKRAVDINPFLVVVAVLFGGTLLGVVGALVAVPVAASIQIALREYLDARGIKPRPEGPPEMPPEDRAASRRLKRRRPRRLAAEALRAVVPSRARRLRLHSPAAPSRLCPLGHHPAVAPLRSVLGLRSRAMAAEASVGGDGCRFVVRISRYEFAD